MAFLSRSLQLATAISLLGLPFAYGQNSARPGPNSDPIYQQLRNIALGKEAVTVHEFDLKRDAATFHLHSGTVCFFSPVQGKVTGAVFSGDGSMSLNPPLAVERRNLKYLTKSDEFSEKFSEVVLRFPDSTYDDIKKAGTAAMASGPIDPKLKETEREFHEAISPAPRNRSRSRSHNYRALCVP
jgi:hypothetical protein